MSRPSCRLVSTYEMVGLFTEAAGRSVGLKHGCANALQRMEAGQSGHAGAEAAEGGTENEGTKLYMSRNLLPSMSAWRPSAAAAR